MPEKSSPIGSFVPGDPRTREPWHVNQQTILRAGILGVIAVALFVTLIVRLWALQIISGNEYLRIAQNNQVRTVRLQAPRGSIIDIKGRVLVTNRITHEVRVWYAELPSKGDRPTRYAVLKKLARVLKIRPHRLYREVGSRKTDPLNPVIAKADINRWQSNYILERADEFPGVEVASRYVRDYPRGWLAAQTLGYVGSATEAEIKADPSGSIRSGDLIGQSGVEAAFNRYLSGTPGKASQRIDSQGRPHSELVANPEPTPGETVRLTIDADLQSVAQKALKNGIQAARNSSCSGCWNADGGAIVALDPNNGAVLALASNPTYSPAVYSGHDTNRKLARWGLTASTMDEFNTPAINRATSGLYPPGSTFKPVTAIAAMQSGQLNPIENLHCTGELKDHGSTFKNWDPNANSWINLQTALALSCDTYFYQLGQRIWGLPPSYGEPIQKWAKIFGLGQHTGIEIGDYAGVVPTKKWQRNYYKAPEDKTWKPGDSINLSIGQKDLQTTPLQMARLYAAIATGKLVSPHLLASVEREKRVIKPGISKAPQTIAPGSDFSQKLDIIRGGLYMATHEVGIGTSAPVFGNFPIPIAGKTGTAEKYLSKYGQNFDQAWWCGYGAVGRPTLVVCAVIENGGHGGTSAAPAALEVFRQFFTPNDKSGTYTSATHSD
ncbi:MAG: penicillin-binding protein 2 [Gaiellaceae bacterium]